MSWLFSPPKPPSPPDPAKHPMWVDALPAGPNLGIYSPASMQELSAAMGARRSPSPLEMLEMRLRWSPLTVFDNAFVHVGTETAFVFVVKGDKAVKLEDDASMFPSDQLITKLRLLKEP